MGKKVFVSIITVMAFITVGKVVETATGIDGITQVSMGAALFRTLQIWA